MLGVSDRITDDLDPEVSKGWRREGTKSAYILQKDLENSSRLLIDQTRDTLDATSTSETTDGGLGNALDVVAKDLAMTLCATLSETLKIKSATLELKGKTIPTYLSTFTAARHCVMKCFVRGGMKTKFVGSEWLGR